MAEHWIFWPSLAEGAAEILVTGPEAHHARVKRLRTGETVCLFDGAGTVAQANVIRNSNDGLRVLVQSVRRVAPQSAISLAVSPPKGNRLDWMLEKLSEVGVRHIYLVRFDRTVVRPEELNLERLRRKVVEACKQAHCAWIPQIQPLGGPETLADLLQQVRVAVLAHPEAGSEPLLRCLARIHPPEDALAVVGPEGGLTEREVRLLLQANACPVSLGPTILRTETAAIVLVAALNLYTRAEVRHGRPPENHRQAF